MSVVLLFSAPLRHSDRKVVEAVSINCDSQAVEEQDDLINGDASREQDDYAHQSKFRTALPQLLATGAQSLLLLALGMMTSMPTVVIAALHNAKTGLSISDTQASWIAGIIFACQPVGSILSGILSDKFGRKKCMLLVSIPQLIGWILIYTTQSVMNLYVAGVMMGFSIGFMEAPTLSYVGEISQPHLRATLATFTSICVSSGLMLMYLLGTLTDWRTSAALSASVPIITVIAILQVPESPVWLLSKGRTNEAESSLCWLRGWVTAEVVHKEFLSLIAYVNKSRHTERKLYSPSKGNSYTEVCDNGNGSTSTDETESFQKNRWYQFNKIKYLYQPEMYRPLRLVILFFFFYHCAALSGFRPYMVQIYQTLHLPIDPHWFTVVSGLIQIAGGLSCVATVHYTGKRFISMLSMTLCSTCCLLLGWYTLFNTQSTSSYSHPWIPLVLFVILFYSLSLGINPIPWTLISEVFPTRGRGVGGGISAASFYILFFLCTKTFLDLENLIQLHGVFFFYGSLGLVGLVFLYFYLPETEGKKLEEVEKGFKNGTKRSENHV